MKNNINFIVFLIFEICSIKTSKPILLSINNTIIDNININKYNLIIFINLLNIFNYFLFFEI